MSDVTAIGAKYIQITGFRVFSTEYLYNAVLTCKD
jgi:hypothetical protein